jgi:hypothetical protein
MPQNVTFGPNLEIVTHAPKALLSDRSLPDLKSMFKTFLTASEVTTKDSSVAQSTYFPLVATELAVATTGP